MQYSSLPTRYTLTFGQNAGGSYIRTVPAASQIGITNGAASFYDGFPPLCFQPVGSGGVPPFGQDTNGILNIITTWQQWQQAGALTQYDSTFSTAIGGYPKGALLQSSVTAGLIWISTADNNTTNPDSGGTNWLGFGPASAAGLLYKKQALTASSSTMAIDMSLGWDVALTLSASVTTVTVSNWPATGTLGRLLLEIASTGAYTMAGWPGTTIWASGSAPTITSGSGKKDTLILTSNDGGTNFRGYIVAQNLS